MHLPLSVGVCPSHRAHEENQMSRVGSLFNVGPTDQAWVLRFGDQFLYPWSHLKTLACRSCLLVCLFCILRIELTPHKTTNPTSISAIASFILSALYKRPPYRAPVWSLHDFLCDYPRHYWTRLHLFPIPTIFNDPESGMYKSLVTILAKKW